MEYCISKPSNYLSKFIKHYWTFDSCLAVGQNHIQRIVPSGLLELIFYLGDKPVSVSSTKSISENTVITGHLGEFYDIKVSGQLSLFSIIFKPHGLSVFFDIPLNEIYNQNVPLKNIFKHDTVELETRLVESNSFADRKEIVERYFFKILQKNRDTYHYDRIEYCINIINQSKGIVDIDFLASEACLSRKQFERIFSSYVGTSPKQFLKTIRFQHAIDIKSKNKKISLTDLTYSCGYYDQSHMINDFQKLTGMTPRQYFKESEPFSDYFQQ